LAANSSDTLLGWPWTLLLCRADARAKPGVDDARFSAAPPKAVLATLVVMRGVADDTSTDGNDSPAEIDCLLLSTKLNSTVGAPPPPQSGRNGSSADARQPPGMTPPRSVRTPSDRSQIPQPRETL
jgi:hypothetical protein